MEDLYRNIIRQGITALKAQKHHSQVVIINKLRYLKYKISEPSLSNILNNRKVGLSILKSVADGIQELVKSEIGLIWKNHEFISDKKSSPNRLKEIPELSSKSPSLVLKPGFAFHENGRIPISHKVEFLSSAQNEILEFGVTLSTFCSYFFSRNDQEFKVPIIKLLEKGINYKCYLLDPECNEARLYFDDRARISEDDKKGPEKIKETINKLRRIRDEFQKAEYLGTFQIYTYKHVPYNYFTTVDRGKPIGKIMVSHYIYGESRANCPVMEISRKESPTLFRRYSDSLTRLIKKANVVP